MPGGTCACAIPVANKAKAVTTMDFMEGRQETKKRGGSIAATDAPRSPEISDYPTAI
jgi:hypothetical protein